jgi:hypothetical protein
MVQDRSLKKLEDPRRYSFQKERFALSGKVYSRSDFMAQLVFAMLKSRAPNVV